MSDLAEFLLARIAEDEERATFVQAQQAGQNWSPFEPWRLSWQDEYDLLCIEPSRVLAECDAKRRIVEDHGDQHDCTSLSAGDWPYIGCTTLRLLALPYADHPDYDEAWRP